MKYSISHEWVLPAEGVGTVGISAYAQKELGEIVYIDLPPIGKQLRAGDELAVLESTKAAADIYTPVSGEVVEVNHNALEQINQQPEKGGWLCKISLTHPQELEALLDSSEYGELIACHFGTN